ncbi:hypothetical protein [Timonella sp. A28]|uniref:hypothetical protein n=1 Tax=Timonella sp. A28 TaxID=3442640 RepID=UPI003EC13E5F
MTAYQKLLDQARNTYHVAEIQGIEGVAHWLKTFGAVSFDYEKYTEALFDEFVNPELVVAAYTICDPALLASRARAIEHEMKEWPPEEDEYSGLPRDEWDTIQDELSGMQRLIVLLERTSQNNTDIGNFRVAGFGQWLRETLWAATGVLPLDSGAITKESYLFTQAYELHKR